MSYQTELGQLLDLLTAPEGKVDLNRFSIERHSKIVRYKTAFYSFYMPVALALILVCGPLCMRESVLTVVLRRESKSRRPSMKAKRFC